MNRIRYKALQLAIAMALAGAFAPLAQAQGTAPSTDHSAMMKGDQSTGANPGNMAGMMQQHQCDMGMMRNGSGMNMMQHGDGMNMMQHGGGMDMMQHGDNMDMMQHHQAMMAKMHSMHGGAPTLPGQDAFGAIGEIVALLEADPGTDWSKVDVEALRAHLIDMSEVTLNATATPKPIDGGIQIAVSGTGRTLAAIQRMVPVHAAEIDGQKGWSVKTSPLPDGVLLTVTTADPKEVAHIRGLGFAGIMVGGSHHQAHHLAIAKGEPMHAGGMNHAEHVR